MKKISALLVLLAMVFAVGAQTEILTHDFTLYEINKDNGQMITGNPYTIYQYTDSGKTVFFNFFATWCTYCWQFKQQGYLEQLQSQYGPNGTNEVMAFAVEGDEGNYSALTGGPDASGYASQGNWLQGTNYPVIPTYLSPNTQSILSEYSISAFPTVWMVCPSRWAYKIDRGTAASMYGKIASKCPQFNTSAQANAALFSKIEGIKNNYICEATITPKIQLQNVSENPMTSVELTITLDGTPTTFNWSGNLAKYEFETVTLPTIHANTNGSHNYSVAITKVNGINDPDPLKGTVSKSFSVAVTPTTANVNATFGSSIPSTWVQDNGYLYVYSDKGALYFNAFSIPAGYSDNLNLPPLNLTRFAHPVLKFDLSHKRRNSSSSDQLMVQWSANCDNNWHTLYDVSDPELATVSGNSSQAFVPSSTSQWRTETIDLSGVTDLSNVLLRFSFISGHGNIIWIDNVRIVDGTGVEDHESESISLYPNPTSDVVYVQTADMVNEVQVYNIQGQLVRTFNGDVHSISLAGFAHGIYTLKIMTEKGMSIQKVVKQ